VIGIIDEMETNAVLTFLTGDILQSNAEALVNTVNCVGVMGRGIALQFKNKFPANFEAYVHACERGELEPGRMFVYPTGWLTGPKYIINFPTKRHWRGKSRIEDIESGLIALRKEIQDRHIRSIAVPPLGAGLGGLEWKVVRPRIERALEPLNDVQVTIFEPNPEHRSQTGVPNSPPPEMNPSRAALVGLVSRYLDGLLDPLVTLLEVQKLMYFMQEAGQPLRLQFVPETYGPYATNLRHLLKRIEGYFLTGYADGGESPTKELKLVPGAVEDAERILATSPDTMERIHRVAELVDGFETPFGLELLATVHWVAAHRATNDLEGVVRGVYGWNDRKRQFSERQIKRAYQVLSQKDWLTSAVAS
jgi:O-acetyl-ADP-ribose deacetylase (regulator of RNase III)